jgi:hypothetical protein
VRRVVSQLALGVAEVELGRFGAGMRVHSVLRVRDRDREERRRDIQKPWSTFAQFMVQLLRFSTGRTAAVVVDLAMGLTTVMEVTERRPMMLSTEMIAGLGQTVIRRWELIQTEPHVG